MQTDIAEGAALLNGHMKRQVFICHVITHMLKQAEAAKNHTLHHGKVLVYDEVKEHLLVLL